MDFPRFAPLGEAALVVEFGDQIDLAINARVHALARWLEGRALPGVIENLPGYASLVVHFDPQQVEFDDLVSELRRGLGEIRIESRPARLIKVPARYGGAFGPDLPYVAERSGLSEREVIALHTSAIYTVFMLGFTPGFAYLGTLPPALAMPRLETPRTQVPAGSVAIAGRQTGIYPRSSPGGWRLIGRTDLVLFDPGLQEPTLLRPGDRVQFVSVE